jgi:hypothetical protein
MRTVTLAFRTRTAWGTQGSEGYVPTCAVRARRDLRHPGASQAPIGPGLESWEHCST